jgi:hypothetical protein
MDVPGGTAPAPSGALIGPAAVRLTLGRSRRLTVLLICLHASVLVPVWSIGIPAAVASAIAAAVLCHALWSVRRYGLGADDGSVAAIEVDGSHRCEIRRRDGRVLSGRVAETTLVTGELVILAVGRGSFRPTCHVAIVADMVDREACRRLRVLLKWAPGAEPERR